MISFGRFSGDSGCLKLASLEREATPESAINFGIRLYLSELSLSDTVLIIEKLGVDRHRSNVHRWVQKADLQPTDGADPNHVAIDETVIQLNDERYWLYAAVDPDTNRLLHVRLYPTKPRSSRCFYRNYVRNIRSTTWSFSSTVYRGCRRPVTDTGYDSSMLHMGSGMPSNVSFAR
jgi:hypothetical protein